MMGFGGVLIVLAVMAIVVMAVAARALVGAMRRARRVVKAPRLQAEATVINKRTEMLGSGRGEPGQRYYATFQFPDGQRLELMMSGPESGVITVGDQGTLDWQGPRYLGFAREILR